jgi:hypothetical protein
VESQPHPERGAVEGARRSRRQQREAMELLDAIVRRPEFMYSMRLEQATCRSSATSRRCTRAPNSRTGRRGAQAQPSTASALDPDGPKLPADGAVSGRGSRRATCVAASHGQAFDAQACASYEAQAKAMHHAPGGQGAT